MLTGSNIKRLLLVMLFCSYLVGYSQSTGLSEAELIKKANTLFDKKEYKEAMTYYAQLVSVHPSNLEYNYKFGVSSLYGDRSDRRRPIRYLNNALRSMGDDHQLTYHLAIAYYQNQEFSNAMQFLNLYLSKLGPNSPERAFILEKINACHTARSLERNNIIDEIISSSEFKTDNFHRAYRADELDGMLVLKPDVFATPGEKKSGQNSFVFISEPRNILYFSGYENNSTQKDIFRVTLDESGEWGTPEKLPGVINTSFDEDYPVVTDNGRTLYFASKGHNSIGGYDIFKSNYDPETNTYSTPENMGVGVNSPFDDFLYLPDKTGRFAWFTTNRDNLDNAVTVYKVKLNENVSESDRQLALNMTQGEQTPPTTAQTSSVAGSQRGTGASQQTAGTDSREITPAERAAMLRNEREMANKMADSSYMWVTQTRNQIRDLGNKRDRANNVTSSKQETVKILEVKFQEVIASIPASTSDIEFEKKLENAINLKSEIYQYRLRADEANLIAWNLGRQLRTKNDEFENIKVGAGKVQSSSMSGKVEETNIAFLELKSAINLADTLSDYTHRLMRIASDEVSYEMPSTELAFVNGLRNDNENKSLLAKTEKSNTQQKPEDIPIVVIDRRTQPVAAKEPEKPSVTPVALVNEVFIDQSAIAMVIPVADQPEIRFDVDAINPVNLVSPVEYALTVPKPEFTEYDLVVNLEMDTRAIVPLAEPVDVSAIAYRNFHLNDNISVDLSPEPLEPVALVKMVLVDQDALTMMLTDLEQPEIRFNADAIKPVNLVIPVEYALAIPQLEFIDNLTVDLSPEPVEPVAIAKIVMPPSFIMNFEEEMPVISSSVDAIEPSPIIATVNLKDSQSQIEITDDEHLIEVQAEALRILEIVKQVNFDENAYQLAVAVDEHIEILNGLASIEIYELIQPIDVNLLAYDLPIAESDITISVGSETIALPERASLAHIIDIPENLKGGLALEPEDPEIIIESRLFEPIALVQQVKFPSSTGLTLAVEDIHITFDDKVAISILVADLIEPVEIPMFHSNLAAVGFDELEIVIEKPVIARVPRQVDLVHYDLKETIYQAIDNDFMEINFMPEDTKEIELAGIISDQISDTPVEDSIPGIQYTGNEYLLMRESLSVVTNIETSLNDMELIKAALTDPYNLEYEELLYAASIATNPGDKIRIYNMAFIHIDRDWRAYNNAGVTSMGIHDLDQAECLLFQASLISDQNGKILNNMGILASLKNDYNSAGEHFMAAGELGVNAEYNMQVLKSMTENNQIHQSEFRQEIGEHRYHPSFRLRRQ